MPYRAPDRHGVTPQGRGRFPGFDVLDEVPRWDDVTAGVVLARLQPYTDLAFFTPAENAVVRPLCDLLLEQDCEPRVPVVALIDARLAAGETDGWHYDDMPPDPQAWRETLSALDQDAQDAYGTGFGQIDTGGQAGLIHAVNDASTRDRPWHEWPASRVWSLWTRYACAAFYSHPWAWNEIGFGGPAYPRGYKNVGLNARERWEVADHDDTDPVAFADRIEQARDRHKQLTGGAPAPHGATSGRQGGGAA